MASFEDAGLAPWEAVDDLLGPGTSTSGDAAGGSPTPRTGARDRRWWSIAPDPVLPPIGARRAYVEVLGVYLMFFAAPILAAGLVLGNRSQDLRDTGSWGVYMTGALSVLSYIGLAAVVVLLLNA